MKDQKPNKLRRKILIGGLSLLASALSAMYLCDQRTRDWSFLTHEVTRHPFDPKTFIPLGPRDKLVTGSKEFENLKRFAEPMLAEDANRRGINLADYTVEPRSQTHAYPEDPEHAEPLLDYCKTAVDFLYQRIKGLDKKTIDWHILKKGENFSENYHGKGFIGRCHCPLYEIKLSNQKDPQQSFTHYAKGDTRRGGLNRNMFDGQTLKWWFLLITPGDASIGAPFSEVIPLTTLKSTRPYMKEAGYDGAILADESIAEGLSHLLSLEIAKELNIPGAKKIIDDSARKMVEANERYSLLPNSIRWMEKNGMQAGLDLYMQSPAEFMRRIRAQ